MTSSASTPSTTSSGQPSARIASMQRLDLRAEVVGHRRAVRLVLGIEVVAKRLALGVEDAAEEIWLVVVRPAAVACSARRRSRRSARPAGCADRAARGTRDTGTTTRRPGPELRHETMEDRVQKGRPDDKLPKLVAAGTGFARLQRARGVAGVRDYVRVRRSDRAPEPGTARGLDVRQRAHAARPSVLRARRADRAPAFRCGLHRHLRRRARGS